MRAIVTTILKTILAEVYWLIWVGNETPPAQYITFNAKQSEDAYGDNLPTEEQWVVYVDFFSTTDDQTKADQIKTAMRAGGFALVDDQPIYEPETGRWHNSTTWNYVGVE